MFDASIEFWEPGVNVTIQFQSSIATYAELKHFES